jgi:hypothetical protein
MVKQFCESILQIEVGNNKALPNLVMGLSSSPRLKSVVEVSLSPCYHYQHSSINKAINTLYEKQGLEEEEEQEEKERLAVEKKFIHKER